VVYTRQRCLQRVNLLKLVAGISWGAHLSCLTLLYRGLIGSVLEYGSVCFTNMAKTHMLGLESMQYRVLGIAFGLMGSTSNNCLDVLRGIPPLTEKFATSATLFLSIGPPFERLGVLGALNMGRCIKG
jgi:hypothetical protein